MAAARVDYAHMYNSRHRAGALGAQDADMAMDEIDRLRREVIRLKVATGELGIAALLTLVD